MPTPTPEARPEGTPAEPSTPDAPDAGTVGDATSAPVGDVTVEAVWVDTVPPELADADDDLDDDDLDDDDFATVPATSGAGLAARLGTEMLGTFALVLVILGVTVFAPISGVGTMGTAIAAGLTLAGLGAAFGHISGGHFNPAVTLGAAIAGRARWLDVPLYWFAQVLGALAAAATVFITIPTTLPAALQVADVRTFFATTANSWGESSQLWTASGQTTAFDLRTAFVLELLAAALLTAVVLGTMRRRTVRSTAPYAMGLTYAAVLLLTAPVTGGSANPARSLASAVFAGGDAMGQVWVFVVAPIVGAAIVGLAYFGFARPQDAEDDREGLLVIERY
ncbi:MIP/aquaporin family protein [Actinotalea subterranea]|uniref:MIP/aquaporin family protein n=1 Tax=Actinotalea subterranea TaxID=2607497 RepID=UPI00165E9C19|nr:aquaporin [Actinotalea subterranea]